MLSGVSAVHLAVHGSTEEIGNSISQKCHGNPTTLRQKSILLQTIGKQDDLIHSVTVDVIYIHWHLSSVWILPMCGGKFLLTWILNIGLYSKLSIYNCFACYLNCIVFKLQPWNLITGINKLILNKGEFSVFVQRIYTECSRSF